MRMKKVKIENRTSLTRVDFAILGLVILKAHLQSRWKFLVKKYLVENYGGKFWLTISSDFVETK